MKKTLIILILLFISANLFSQSIQLRKPTIGDIWPAYSIQRIEWNSSNIDNIKIESSLDSGRTWTIIQSSYPATAQFYEWEVTNKTSDSCFIRVSDASDPTKSSSNYPSNPFKIPKPGITIEAPAVIAYRTTILPITWISSGIRKVNIYASYNNKQSFIKIADSINANNFYFNWLVPDSLSSQCFINIQDVSSIVYSDTTKEAFTISSLASNSISKFKGGNFDGHSSANNKPLLLNLLTLNNGDSLYGSSNQSISWSFQNVERINIYYSSDNGTTWQLIADKIPAYATKFNWKVSSAQTNQGRIKIVDALDTFLSSVSTKPFVIRKKELKFNQPDSTTIAYKNTVLPVGWISGGVNDIKIKILFNNKDSSIVDSIPANNEIFNWIINQTTSDTIKLVLQDLTDPSTADTTKQIVLKQLVVGDNAKYKGGGFDGHASKTNTKSTLQLLSPNGNEQLSVLTNFIVKWRSNNIDRLKLEYSLDSGKNWTLISADISAASNNYTWKTPNNPTTKCLLKISDADENSLVDISDSTFTLLPKKILNLTDSTNWTRGTAKSIEWSARGIDSIRISTKNGINLPWKILVDSIPAIYELYNWVLPSDLSDSIWIKIVDITDSSVNDTKTYFKKTNNLAENTVSKFRGGKFDGHTQRSNINKIVITRPLANEVLVGGSQYSITWSTVNLEDSVWIQYSIDSGKTWATVTRTIATSGRYEWTVPTSFQSSSADLSFGFIKSNSINELAINRVMPESDISQKNIREIIRNQTSTNSNINSTNCLIRVLDILSGDLLVGKTTNTFTIVGSRSRLKDSINFSKPNDFDLTQSKQLLNASSKFNRPINFLIVKGSNKAIISANQLIVSKPGKVTIGAFINSDTAYLPTDTVYQTICINPEKPSIEYNGKLTLCSNDTINVSGPASFSQYLWSNKDTSKNIRVNSAIAISLKVGEDGCFSKSSDTLQFSQNIFTATITSIGQNSFCKGDSVILNSNSSSGNQWFKNGIAINGANNASFTAVESGTYTLKTTNANGCSSTLSSAINVIANASPTKPIITRNGSNIVSSSASGNQWYENDNIITGEISNSYTPKKNGYFKTQVKNGGCLSPMSETFYYFMNSDVSNIYQLMPNPVSDLLTIQAISSVNLTSFKLIDVNGKVLLSNSFIKSITINLKPYKTGIYTLILLDNTTKAEKSKQIIKIN